MTHHPSWVPGHPNQKKKMTFWGGIKRHNHHQPPATIVGPKYQTSTEVFTIIGKYRKLLYYVIKHGGKGKRYNPNFSYHSSALPFIGHKSRLSSPDP